MNPDTGKVLLEGEVYTRPRLAATLRLLQEGPQQLYSGPVGRALVADSAAAGGILSMEDLQQYRVTWEQPVQVELPNTPGFTLHSSPPPGSGAVTAAILAIVGSAAPGPPDRTRPAAWQRWNYSDIILI